MIRLSARFASTAASVTSSAAPGRLRKVTIPPPPPQGSPPFRRPKLSTYFWLLGLFGGSTITYKYFSKKAPAPQLTPPTADVTTSSLPTPPVDPSTPQSTAKAAQPGIPTLMSSLTTTPDRRPYCAVIVLQPTFLKNKLQMIRSLAALQATVGGAGCDVSISVGFSQSLWQHVWRFMCAGDPHLKAVGWQDSVRPELHTPRTKKREDPEPPQPFVVDKLVPFELPEAVRDADEACVVIVGMSPVHVTAAVETLSDAYSGVWGPLLGSFTVSSVDEYAPILPKSTADAAVTRQGFTFALVTSHPFHFNDPGVTVPLLQRSDGANITAVLSTNVTELMASAAHQLKPKQADLFYFPTRIQLTRLQDSLM